MEMEQRIHTTMKRDKSHRHIFIMIIFDVYKGHLCEKPFHQINIVHSTLFISLGAHFFQTKNIACVYVDCRHMQTRNLLAENKYPFKIKIRDEKNMIWKRKLEREREKITQPFVGTMYLHKNIRNRNTRAIAAHSRRRKR